LFVFHLANHYPTIAQDNGLFLQETNTLRKVMLIDLLVMSPFEVKADGFQLPGQI
jgi:hypothetical protein